MNNFSFKLTMVGLALTVLAITLVALSCSQPIFVAFIIVGSFITFIIIPDLILVIYNQKKEQK